MSEFVSKDCDWVYLDGGANNGVILPVAHGINMVQFHIKGGGLITYRRVVPTEMHGDNIIFRISE